MDQHYLRRLFSRRRRLSTHEKATKKEIFSPESHELSLESEGPLPSDDRALRRPSTSFSRATTCRPSILYSENAPSPPGETLGSYSDAYNHPRKSFSGLRRATTASQSVMHSAPKRRKNSTLLFRKSADEPGDGRSRWTRASLDQRQEHEEHMRRPSTSGWLERLKSTNFKSYDRTSIWQPDLPPFEVLNGNRHLPSPIPDFGEIRGFTHEKPKPRTDISSGAAARAAAAAQNELLESMRKMRLSEMRVARDSESGIGIERADSTVDLEGPVVRQGKLNSFFGNLC